MKSRPSRSSFFLVAGLMTISVFGPALSAQVSPVPSSTKPNTFDPPSSEGWHVDITPYLWLAGVHGTAGVAGHDASIHASFGDVANYLNLGFMGAGELRYTRILLPMDFMWIKLTDNKALDFDRGATTAKAESRQTVFTPGFGYRLIDQEKVKVDARVGLRYWHLNSSLNVQGPVVNNGVSGTADWVDALGGAQISLALSPKMSVTIAGDAGGGGANSDYEVLGIFGVRMAKKWVLKARRRASFMTRRNPGS
jgi:hypothetical protein